MKGLFYFTPAVLLLLLDACSSPGNKEKSPDTLHLGGKVCNVEEYTPEAFDHLPSSGPEQLEDRNEIIPLEDSAKAWRDEQGQVLTLKTVKGVELKLANSPHDAAANDFVRYVYVGNMKTISCWYLDVYRADGIHGLLVNQLDGRMTKLWNKPRLSPDLEHFMVSNFDSSKTAVSNGLQLWELTTDGPKLKWEQSFSGWGVEDLRWIDNRNIAFVKRSRGTNGYDKHLFRKIKILD